MQSFNKAISEAINERLWSRVSDELPDDNKLVLVRFDLDNGYSAYEVCKYRLDNDVWYVYYMDMAMSKLSRAYPPAAWVYITENAAYKIWGMDYDIVVYCKKRRIYSAYIEYLKEFVTEGCKCNPKNNAYAVPYSFVEWMKSEGIDIESVLGEE